MITINLNGSEKSIAAGTSIDGVLNHFKISTQLVIVEKNGMVIPKGEFSKHQVESGDTLEIIQLMGGG